MKNPACYECFGRGYTGTTTGDPRQVLTCLVCKGTGLRPAEPAATTKAILVSAEHEHGLTDEQFRALTKATREADEQHQTSGGGTRHWLRECFLPALEDHGLRIAAQPTRQSPHGPGCKRHEGRERLLTEYGRLNSEEFGKQIDSEKVVQRWARFRDDCVLFVLYDGPSEAPAEATRQRMRDG